MLIVPQQGTGHKLYKHYTGYFFDALTFVDLKRFFYRKAPERPIFSSQNAKKQKYPLDIVQEMAFGIRLPPVQSVCRSSTCQVPDGFHRLNRLIITTSLK